MNHPVHSEISTKLPKGDGLVKSLPSYFFVLLVLAGMSFAGEPPEAPSSVLRATAAIEALPAVSSPGIPAASLPEARVIDKKFMALAVISTGSTFADSYTTLFARENWLAGKTHVCNAEIQSAYLYGTHPTVARAYAVASVKSAGALLASYYLRKHHNKFWSLPLIANSVISLQGTTQNMMACN